MTLQLDELGLDAPLALAGQPMQIGVDFIDEDPLQPRTLFEETAMAELAASITERGVLQPISVRSHPEMPGRWMLNFGARRLRACRLASKERIPSFVDESADDYAQVIENEQRERLKPLELAFFVKRRMAAGDSQAEIARRIGKSRQYITFATALIDAPDWLLNAYREGRCRGLSDLYELRKLETARPDVVAQWMTERVSITRDRMDGLRAAISAGSSVRSDAAGTTEVKAALAPAPPVAPSTTERQPLTRVPTLKPQTGLGPISSGRLDAPVELRLHAEHDGQVVTIVVDRAPADRSQVFVRLADNVDRTAVSVASLRLLGFLDQ